MRLNSIRTRTLLVLILICMAIVLMLGGLWLYTLSQNIKNNVIMADLHDSHLMANYVYRYVEGVETSVIMVSSHQDMVKAIRDRNMTIASRLLNQLVDTTPQDDIAYLTDKDGKLLYSTCSTATLTQDLRNITQGKNASYISGIFYSGEFNDHVFAIVSPVRDNGSIIGYVIDEVSPADLDNFIIKEKTGHVHQIILVDGNGKIIYYDNVSMMRQHANISSYTPVKKALIGQEGFIEDLGLNTYQRSIVAFAPVPKTGWGLLVTTQTDIAYQPLQRHIFLLLGMCALFVSALAAFGYFASTYLINPISDLSRTMQKVSAGSYDVSIPVTRKDEIGDLERAFNGLVAEIKARDEKIIAEKDRSQFYMDLMAHDINNMNHIGMGYLEMAIDKLKGCADADSIALMEKTYEALQSSSALIDNVRTVQKLQTSDLVPEIVDMGEMLGEVRDKYSNYPGHDVTIDYQPVKGYCIRASKLFKEVFANIVENAIKHSDPEKPLWIGIRLSSVKEGEKGYYRVEIEDNGPGIPDGNKQTIFSRYKRGQTAAHGKGLGLYIVQMLVEEFGGKVWAEDGVAGDHTKGARFVILMPAASCTNIP